MNGAVGEGEEFASRKAVGEINGRKEHIWKLIPLKLPIPARYLKRLEAPPRGHKPQTEV